MDRKRLIRTLIEDVTLNAPRGSPTIQVGIRWRSQRAQSLTLDRPQPPWKRRRHIPATVERVRHLAETLPDLTIADTLNAAGLRTPDGRSFTRGAVCAIRLSHGIAPFRPPPPADTWSVRACAAHFGVSSGVVYTWIAQRVVSAQKPGRGRPWAITLDALAEDRCRDWIATSGHLPHPNPDEEES